MKKIILTGGGTAGHVTPNLALLPGLKEEGFDILYVGSETGIEKELAGAAGLQYKAIATGKLRRYFSLKNFTDPFRVIKGFFQSLSIVNSYKPDIVFSKGGFVAVPVTCAAWLKKVPVIAHESDMTPGLANRIAKPFATRICCNFPETLQYLPEGKGVLSGSPVRAELLNATKQEGLDFIGFEADKPVLMVIGGSLGSVYVNKMVRANMEKLLPVFNIVHVCGRGNLEPSLEGLDGYKQYEYLGDDVRYLFAAAELIISRAGANAICEIVSLKKPNILIPLSARASRGDQILNARSFEKQGYSVVLEEEELTEQKLYDSIMKLWAEKEAYIERMKTAELADGVGRILSLVKELA